MKLAAARRGASRVTAFGFQAAGTAWLCIGGVSTPRDQKSLVVGLAVFACLVSAVLLRVVCCVPHVRLRWVITTSARLLMQAGAAVALGVGLDRRDLLLGYSAILMLIGGFISVVGLTADAFYDDETSEEKRTETDPELGVPLLGAFSGGELRRSDRVV